MGDVYRLIALSSREHLDFPGAQPPNELWDHSFPSAEGDGVVNVAQVGLEAGGDVDDAKLAVKVGDFEGSGGQLLPELLLSGMAFVQLLAGVEGAAVDGRDEPVRNGVDGLVDVGVCAEEYFSCSRGYRGVFLLSFSQGTVEAKGGQVFVGYDDVE